MDVKEKWETVEQDVVFDHERLDVYRLARELVVLVTGFLKRNVSRDLRDQLDRASTSILFNIAEGAGKAARAEKQRFYEIARGSATETAAQLDVLHIRGTIDYDQYRAARHLLLRIIQMLSRLAGAARKA
jgi:four helix bundle protein